jgi:hypothetical protein
MIRKQSPKEISPNKPSPPPSVNIPLMGGSK